MSGHSKWSQIKHKKGLADKARGQIFTKLGNAITIAVREGGGIADPNSNFRLRLAIEKARQANMPKVNIDRAVARGLGKDASGQLEEVIYEGFGPGKVAVIISAVTGNRQRTNSLLKNLFNEYGGILAGPGSVSYLFRKCGAIKVQKEDSYDKYLEIALAEGCLDIEDLGDTVIFYTEVNSLHKVKENLLAKNLKIIDEELVFRPESLVKIEDREIAKKIINFISRLEQEDDVQKVSANFDIPDNLLQQI